MATKENLVTASETDIGALRLGVDSQEITCSGRAEVRDLAVALAAGVQRELLLYTRDLEPVIFDQQPFLDTVSSVIRNHRDIRLRILIQDGRSAVQNGHRLIELSRRLSSHIEYRRPSPRHMDYGKTYLLADNSGYLLRPMAGRYEGTASFNNPGEVSRLKEYFLEVWEHGEPDPELRRLHL